MAKFLWLRMVHYLSLGFINIQFVFVNIIDDYTIVAKVTQLLLLSGFLVMPIFGCLGIINNIVTHS